MSKKSELSICIGNNIRLLRRKAHLTQEQVAEKMNEHGILSSRSSYSQIECGINNVRVYELVALSEIFGVDYNEFFKNVKTDKERGQQYAKM